LPGPPRPAPPQQAPSLYVEQSSAIILLLRM
jgi:hypothetical protein